MIAMKCVTLCLALMILSGAAVQAPASRPTSPGLTDLAGVIRHPLDIGTHRGAVIVFVRTDCPISNAYAPEIRRMVDQYAARGIDFYLVYAMKDLPEAEAREHATQYAYNCPTLIDRRHELVKALGATVTPEAFVLSAAGKVGYRGRIDDLFVGLGRQKNAPTTHELRDAVAAVAAGKEPPVDRAKAVGCAITED